MTARWRVHVEKIAVFAHDTFNFGKHGEDNQSYGYWNCWELRFKGIFTVSDAVKLRNSDFQAFRKENGMGRDFLVLSLPRLVPDAILRPFEYPFELGENDGGEN